MFSRIYKGHLKRVTVAVLLCITAASTFIEPAYSSWLSEWIGDGMDAAAKLDPSKAIREEYERARKKALAGLRRLDPGRISREMNASLQKRLAKLRAPKNGVIDLRRTDMGSSVTKFLTNFAQGNKRSSALDEFSYNVNVRELVLRCRVRHRHNWGKIFPGQGAIDLYDLTQSAYVKFNFKTNSAEYKIDLGPLAPKIDSRTIERLSDGNIIGALETLVPGAVGEAMHHEERDEYDAVRNRYVAKYGKDNVYFASRKFVNWTTPESVARYIGNGIASLGASVYPQLMADLRKQAENELPQMTKWLRSHGMEGAEGAARQLLSGQQPRWPFLKFEMTTVRYESRNKPLNAFATPWVAVNHVAFVIVWKDGNKNASSTVSMKPAGQGFRNDMPFTPMRKPSVVQKAHANGSQSASLSFQADPVQISETAKRNRVGSIRPIQPVQSSVTSPSRPVVPLYGKKTTANLLEQRASRSVRDPGSAPQIQRGTRGKTRQLQSMDSAVPQRSYLLRDQLQTP